MDPSGVGQRPAQPVRALFACLRYATSVDTISLDLL